MNTQSSKIDNHNIAIKDEVATITLQSNIDIDEAKEVCQLAYDALLQIRYIHLLTQNYCINKGSFCIKISNNKATVYDFNHINTTKQQRDNLKAEMRSFCEVKEFEFKTAKQLKNN